MWISLLLCKMFFSLLIFQRFCLLFLLSPGFLVDLVYTEEIIDHKLLNTVRTFNEDFGTIGKRTRRTYTGQAQDISTETAQQRKGKGSGS